MALSSSDSFSEFFRRAPWAIRSAVVVCWGLGILSVIGSAVVVTRIFSVRHEFQVKTEHEAMVKRNRPTHPGDPYQHTFEVQDLSVPLSGRKTVKSAYAQFGLLFDCPTEESKKAMELSRAFVLDAIFEAAADFRVEDFRSEAGFRGFKQSILARLRARLDDDTPRDLSFQSWLMN